MRVKICGITQIDQGQQIAALGVHSLGFICVPQSPRYVPPQTIREIAAHLPPATVRVGVFANHAPEEIIEVATQGNLSAIQLHGQESPEFCQQLRQQIDPEIELIKAFRVKSRETLNATVNYYNHVDTLLLDAYHPQALGGTGQTINWQDLLSFQPQLPWLLAGGLNPDNILEALAQLAPNGIDLSSGVELAPGNKDLSKVQQLMAKINNY